MKRSDTFDWASEIRSAAERFGIEPGAEALAALVDHAAAVLADDEDRHLTSIREPRAFVERHIGEAFAGAALLDPDAEGWLLDMGSGNGYPGLAVCAVRPGLRPVLVEASRRKAGFLRQVVEQRFPGGRVVEAQVQRAADLDLDGAPRVVVSRAMGSWEKILPRLLPTLTRETELMIWAGSEVEKIARRRVWLRFELCDKRALPGRSQSWVWRFRPIGG